MRKPERCWVLNKQCSFPAACTIVKLILTVCKNHVSASAKGRLDICLEVQQVMKSWWAPWCPLGGRMLWGEADLELGAKLPTLQEGKKLTDSPLLVCHSGWCLSHGWNVCAWDISKLPSQAVRPGGLSSWLVPLPTCICLVPFEMPCNRPQLLTATLEGERSCLIFGNSVQMSWIPQAKLALDI